MSRVWIYSNFAELEEDHNIGSYEVDPGINPSSLRLHSSQVLQPLPVNVVTPEQQQQHPMARIIIASKDGVEYRGLLINRSEDQVTLLLDDNSQITLRHYDTIFYPHPTALYPLVTLDEQGILCYQIASLTWSCQGDLILDRNNNLSRLDLYAAIDNFQQVNHDRFFQQITLVAGNIPVERDNNYPPGAFLRGAPIQNINPISDPNFNDYLTFFLQEHNLPFGRQYFPLMSLALSQSQRLYFYDLGQDSSRTPLRVGYLFKTPRDLPSSQINVYAIDGMFVGNTRIDEKRKGEEGRIYLGTTSSIIAKTYLQRQDIPIDGNSIWTQTQINITSYLKNKRKTKEQVIARYYVAQSKVSQLVSDETLAKPQITNDGYLEFMFILHPGDEKTWSCSFILEA